LYFHITHYATGAVVVMIVW